MYWKYFNHFMKGWPINCDNEKAFHYHPSVQQSRGAAIDARLHCTPGFPLGELGGVGLRRRLPPEHAVCGGRVFRLFCRPVFLAGGSGLPPRHRPEHGHPGRPGGAVRLSGLRRHCHQRVPR